MVFGVSYRQSLSSVWGIRTALLVVIMLVAMLFAVPSASARTSDANQLRDLQSQLDIVEARLVERENAILEIDQTLSVLMTQKSVLEQRYTEQLVSAYKDAPSRSVGSLLGAEGLKFATQRLQIGSQIAAYRAKLASQMESAGERVVVERERRDAIGELLLIDQAKASGLQRSMKRIRKAKAVKKQKAQPISAPAGSAADLQQLLVSNQTGAATDTASQNSFDTRYWWGPEGKPAGAGGNGFLGGFPSPGSIGGGGPVTKASAALIDQYLTSKGSPMAGQGFFFVLSGQRYGIDPRLVAAIAGAESSFGQQLCGSYNAWGWSCPNSPAQFSSWAEGIERVNRGLRIGYLDSGLTSVVTIHQKYAPSGAANDPTGLNNYWVTNVSKFLSEMGGNPNNIALAGGGSGFGGTGSLKPGN